MSKAILAMAAVFGLACYGPTKAESITYIESITTDGSLGGTAFTNSLVTLTFTADTDNVTFSQGSDLGTDFTQFTNVPSTSTVTVAGVGTATFSDSISLSMFAFPTFSEFGVTDTSTSSDILDTFAVTSEFAGYDLKGPLAPVSGAPGYTAGTIFETNMGVFEFTKNEPGISTVSATVPEPASAMMTALGIAGALSQRRRVWR
jgi:hypothetical protein